MKNVLILMYKANLSTYVSHDCPAYVWTAIQLNLCNLRIMKNNNKWNTEYKTTKVISISTNLFTLYLVIKNMVGIKQRSSQRLQTVTGRYVEPQLHEAVTVLLKRFKTQTGVKTLCNLFC